MAARRDGYNNPPSFPRPSPPPAPPPASGTLVRVECGECAPPVYVKRADMTPALEQIKARLQLAIEHGDAHGWAVARNELLGVLGSDYFNALRDEAGEAVAVAAEMRKAIAALTEKWGDEPLARMLTVWADRLVPPAAEVAQQGGDTSRLFRKKPVMIEAVQWDGTEAGCQRIKAVFPALETLAKTRRLIRPEITYWRIGTLEGGHQVSPGDWIIKGVKGEFYPCKPDVFAATYEHAATPAQGVR